MELTPRPDDNLDTTQAGEFHAGEFQLVRYTRRFPRTCDNIWQAFSGGFRAHDLLLICADVSTNSTTEIAGGDWPIRILYCNEYQEQCLFRCRITIGTVELNSILSIVSTDLYFDSLGFHYETNF